jgi:hypothetical protein
MKKHSDNVRRIPVYSSWIGLITFVILLVFQPTRLTFYALRPADGWLIICLFFQIINGKNYILPFHHRFYVTYYGLFIGILAIIATIIQAFHSNISLEFSFLFNFYRFFRFLLILKFAENILKNFSGNDARKFWRAYTFIGVICLVFSFLEFYNIEPFKLIFTNLYFQSSDAELDSYLVQIERLAGLMGNPNTTALFIVTTMIYPLIRLVSKNVSFLVRGFYFSFVLTAVFVLLVMTGSRSSIFTIAIIFAFILYSKLHKLEELVLVAALTLLLTAVGYFLYSQFKSDIIIQDRVTETIRGENFEFSLKGIAVWSGRYNIWQYRFRTFNLEGNDLAILIGLGYTKPNEDYADNGFVSTFINNGTAGLILKILLFYFFITSGFLKALRNFQENKIDSPYLVIALCAFALLIWELTADLTDHFKLGQLFYLFLSMIMIINGKISRSENL